jgi:hypothetical protein
VDIVRGGYIVRGGSIVRGGFIVRGTGETVVWFELALSLWIILG